MWNRSRGVGRPRGIAEGIASIDKAGHEVLTDGCEARDDGALSLQSSVQECRASQRTLSTLSTHLSSTPRSPLLIATMAAIASALNLLRSVFNDVAPVGGQFEVRLESFLLLAHILTSGPENALQRSFVACVPFGLNPSST